MYNLGMEKKMKLYHAGNVIIEQPDVHYGRKNADFGQGFYTTPDEAFARRWAKDRKGETAYINVYEIDCTDLHVKVLERDEEWFRYIFQNRRLIPDTIDADLIIGPVANDTIFDTFGIFTSGFLTDEEALAMLKEGPAYWQAVLKSEKAALALKWIRADILTPQEISDNQKLLKEEEEAYLKAASSHM